MNYFKFGAMLILLISLFGCSDNEQKQYEDNSIFGKWKLVEQYISSGGPQYKVDVENGSEYIFSNKGTFVSNDFLGCKQGEFRFESNTLNLMYDCDKVQDYGGVISYSASFESGLLILVPKTIICTEGCRYIFKKI
ncbi:hypothetical protein [Flavivirga algicola]|uniref:Lipocalin-like domain-containing protein n=1 Tax=Flavivirga algicola TaxID=2729136 RepID=A0ABX1S223_9FLAO|nr:hypothetical protein [Flavivirga algicola]NMH89421.1 hypothetical protein [Flavivirga algicola]